MYMPDEAEK